MTIREPCSIAPRNPVPCNNKSRTAVPQNLGLKFDIEIFLIVKNQNLGIKSPHLFA